MKSILIGGAVSLIVSIMLTPYLIRVFSRQGFGQEIREEGPAGHKAKRGTPTMGGVAILVAMWAGYLATHLVNQLYASSSGQTPSASGLLVLLLTSSLGLVGFLDDFIKIRKQRNLGLNKTAKLVGQFVATIVFAILVLHFPNKSGFTPASVNLSFVRDITVVSFGVVGFVVFCYVAVSAWSNAVNFTDGLDGLAGGSTAMVLATYVVISFWQFRYNCSNNAFAGCYSVRDPLDLALVAACATAGCVGFLWWNAAPAKIFMGDTGSLALGGLIAGLSIATRTELLLIVIGGLFVVEMMSVVLQIAVFRASGRRLFRMAPFHHHFELAGWAETTVIIRFWLLAGICCMFGLGLFYSDWLSAWGG
ncbi:phospho-N-acetylmuramoyl-pentapeptide-transferase [Solihabitans fulvus]|uniref:Phospho-N-acetylmuramoyl-pentapeptide-transferase n=1 Tax=Solihabitans fulvus TaxID=1892852 RepID=A0A5B2X6D0_9PSEU|nr:phospho-N-acetylmuramoyl-pentapeptide-transferase [Solihabitans fulvus]KAA2258649.1 phospho-N-acetylmuramoyl-pentapeptide-transferase [Solihabitans fulvus]